MSKYIKESEVIELVDKVHQMYKNFAEERQSDYSKHHYREDKIIAKEYRKTTIDISNLLERIKDLNGIDIE